MFRLYLYFIGSIHFNHLSANRTNVLLIFSLYQRIHRMYSKITCIFLKKRTKLQLISPYLKLRVLRCFLINKHDSPGLFRTILLRFDESCASRPLKFQLFEISVIIRWFRHSITSNIAKLDGTMDIYSIV